MKWLKNSRHLYFAKLVFGVVVMLWFWIGMIPQLSDTPINNVIVGLVLATVIVLLFGYKYFLSAYKELFKWHTIGMNTLVFISVVVSYAYGIYRVIINLKLQNFQDNHLSFITAVSIVVILVISEYLNYRIRQRLIHSTDKLKDLKPTFVYKKINGVPTSADANAVEIGDVLWVNHGDQIPLDGLYYNSNQILINESLLTGENDPVIKECNSKLWAGTTNLGNGFEYRVTQLFENSLLQEILEKVDNIQSQRPKIQALADRIAFWFTPVVIMIGILGFLINLFFGYQINHFLKILPWPSEQNYWLARVEWAVYIFVGILSAACPCALGIATPLAVIIGTHKAAKYGVAFNKIDCLERVGKVNAIAFDKTGTLTTGRMKVIKILGDKSYASIICHLELKSLNPIGIALQGILNGDISENQKPLPDGIEVHEEYGVGMIATTNSDVYQIVSLQYAFKNHFNFVDLQIPDEFNEFTTVCFAINGVVKTLIFLSDEIRLNSHKAIDKLKKQGIKVYMISGDTSFAANKIGKQLGIDNIFAEVLPLSKADIIMKIQSEGNKVAYVGDGINDLAALEQADLAITLQTGHRSTQIVSDLTLLQADIYNIYHAIMLTKSVRRMLYFNFFWAFCYNIIAIPLMFFGIIPAILGALLMGLSDISLLCNCLIYWYKPDVS